MIQYILIGNFSPNLIIQYFMITMSSSGVSTNKNVDAKLMQNAILTYTPAQLVKTIKRSVP